MSIHTIKFTIPIKPLSYNQYLYGRTRTRTQKARKWGAKFAEEFAKQVQSNSVAHFRELFNPNEHALSANICFLVPEKDYIASSGPNKGGLSSRSGDLDNYLKALIDILFTKKYNDRGDIDNFNIDDKYIANLTAVKRANKENAKYLIQFEVSIIPIP